MTPIHAQNHRDAPFLLRDHLEKAGLERAGRAKVFSPDPVGLTHAQQHISPSWLNTTVSVSPNATAGQFNLSQKSLLSLGVRHPPPALSCFQPHQCSPGTTTSSCSTVDVHRSTDTPLLLPLCKVIVPWKPVGIDRFTYALPKKEEQSEKPTFQ